MNVYNTLSAESLCIIFGSPFLLYVYQIIKSHKSFLKTVSVRRFSVAPARTS